MASISGPYAILPSIQETDVDVDDNTITVDRSIFSVLDNKRYEWKNTMKGHVGSWCVGSSHDWLVLLDTNGCPFLLNPTFAACIHLPPFPHTVNRDVPSYSHYVQYLQKTFVYKAVLMSYASPSQYMLAILYNYPSKISFCKPSTWVELSDAKRCYCDIVFNNKSLYALAEDGSVEGWDFSQQNPSKILEVKPILENDEEEEREFPKDKFSTQFYLVISEGEILLVKRFIGDFVTADGEVVYEGHDFLSSDDETVVYDVVCPYRTKHFVVYKLDFIKDKWEKKRSLDDRALFLGVNESTSVSVRFFSGCEANSIYFTDDRWEEMSLDYSYGGHDWGIFNMQDRRVKLLDPCAKKMNPPTIWVVPEFPIFLFYILFKIVVSNLTIPRIKSADFGK